MEQSIHFGYQRTKICDGNEFICLRGIINMQDVLYPTVQSVVTENRVILKLFLIMSMIHRVKIKFSARLVCEDTVASWFAAGVKVSKCKRKYAKHVACSKKRMKELSALMETEMMHYSNLTALVVVQEASIVTHDVKLANLQLQ